MDAATQQPRSHLLDDGWIVAIQDEIDRQPACISEVIEPELLGRFDCEMGKPATPYTYYARLSDVEDYLRGYNEATAILAPLRLAAQIRAMMGEDEYMAEVEAQAQRDEVADREFWRQGGW